MVRPHMKQKQQQAVAAAAAAAAAAASEDNIPKASSSKITLDEAVEDTPPTEPPPIIPPTQSSPPSPPVLRPRAGTSIAAESPEPTSGVSEGSQKKSYSRPNSSKNKPKRITDPTLLWPCRINDCDKVFQREADLKRHQRTVVGHEMPGFVRDLVCKHCKLSFTRVRSHLRFPSSSSPHHVE
ncbi:hypothetical protein SISSUDRAFT_102189 [Sistotremastrum suecicum HHB10207 ss-3]|uniref:C2H2-type domain-containing protein n=1 Tax=Sistotremastrum suecicum HHB10207 ss-3 TaxID=1314776 RepID=A0A166B4X0_9AGAM|nr:hypothetical protein SISSUDRAFT_102189 [Sistotremastrum suecicum HHB10207 ss-3]